VAFSPDGHRLASGGVDNTVRLWNFDTGQQIGSPLTGHTELVNAVAFSPDGHQLASASDDYTVRLWNADSGAQIGTPIRAAHRDEQGAPDVSAVSDVAFSPDGRRVAAANYDNTIDLLDAHTGQILGSPLIGHTGHVISVAFSPDGHRLVCAGDDATARLWN